MGAFGRDMREEAMVDGGGVDGMGHRRGGGGDEAVDDHRHLLLTRGEDGAEHRGDLAPTEPREDRQRIGEHAGVMHERAVDGIGLAGQAGIVDARAAPDPVGTPAAEERGIERGGHRGIADPHLADAEEVGAARHGLHAVGDGRRAHAVVHGRTLRDVAGRQLQRQLENAQVELVQGADLADRRASRGEVRDHLRGHLARIGRDALVGDAVVAGEDRDHRIVEHRLGLALPAGEEFDEVLEPAQRAARLGKGQVAGAHGGDRRLVALGQDVQQVEDIGIGRGHGGSRGIGAPHERVPRRESSRNRRHCSPGGGPR